VILKLTKDKMKEIIIGFESLHGIPYILGAINGSHISIVALEVNPKSYYCWKGFYFTLIQKIVDAKYNFWDYDYRWHKVSMIRLFSKK